MSNQLIILIFAILTLISAVWGEIVTHRRCDNHSGKCMVNEVRIDPCAEAAQNIPCKFKRGKSVGIVVDYTPQFSSNTLYSRAYWAQGLIDLPLLNMDTDACKTTTCPVENGNRQTYSFNLNLSRAFPTGLYNVKWKLSGESDNEDDECCFIIKIQLK